MRTRNPWPDRRKRTGGFAIGLTVVILMAVFAGLMIEHFRRHPSVPNRGNDAEPGSVEPVRGRQPSELSP